MIESFARLSTSKKIALQSCQIVRASIESIDFKYSS